MFQGHITYSISRSVVPSPDALFSTVLLSMTSGTGEYTGESASTWSPSLGVTSESVVAGGEGYSNVSDCQSKENSQIFDLPAPPLLQDIDCRSTLHEQSRPSTRGLS